MACAPEHRNGKTPIFRFWTVTSWKSSGSQFESKTHIRDKFIGHF